MTMGPYIKDAQRLGEGRVVQFLGRREGGGSEMNYE